MGIDMNDIEIKIGDKLIHRTTSNIIKILGFVDKKNPKRYSKSVEVLHGRTEKIKLALWNIKKNYIPYEARLDTRLNADTVTPIGSQWMDEYGNVIKINSIHKYECTFDDVRFTLYTPDGKCIGGSRSPETIIEKYKPLNANRDFVGEFQKALTGETASETTVKKDADDKCVKCGGHVEFSQILNTCQICIHQENLRKKREQENELIKEIDNVKHPSHYTSDPSGIECIEITRHRNFAIGNAIKYLWRAGLKEGSSDIQDLEKAIWYIKDEIKRLECKSCQ